MIIEIKDACEIYTDNMNAQHNTGKPQPIMPMILLSQLLNLFTIFIKKFKTKLKPNEMSCPLLSHSYYFFLSDCLI